MSLTKIDPGFLKRHDFKNTIINGNFDLWQRGVTTTTSGATSSYLADRFSITHDSAYSVTMAQSTSVPDFTSAYALGITNVTAVASPATTSSMALRYKVEGYDFRRFYNQEAVLSFWVYSSIAGTYSISFRNAALDATYLAEYTITSPNTWTYINVPISFSYGSIGSSWNNTNGVGIDIAWCLSAGATYAAAAGFWQSGNFVGSVNQTNWAASTNNVFRLSKVQFELGTLASEYEYNSLQDTISRCHRYYEAIDMDSLYAESTVWYGRRTFAYAIQKRATPTFTFSGTQTYNTFSVTQTYWKMSDSQQTNPTGWYGATGTLYVNAEL